MCSCDFDNSADFLDVTHPKARKPHRCYECRAPIAIGEVYERVSGKWEGGVESFTFCLTCEAWTRAFMAEQQRVCGCSGWEMGHVWGAIKEHEQEHGWGGPSLAEQRAAVDRERSQFRRTRVSP